MKRPPSLTLAVLLQWAAAAIAIYAGLALVLSAWALNAAPVSDAVNEAIAESGVTSISSTTITMGVIAAGLLMGSIGVLRIVIGVSLWRGAGWARLVLTVLSALTMVNGFGYLFKGTEGIVQGLVTLALETLVLWLMWNARSRAYFKALKAAPSVS